MGNEVAVYGSSDKALTVSDMRGQVNLIQEVMKEVMKDGEHFGTIPGCGTKKTLLKPGAEKLIMTFRLVPEIDVETVEMPNGHREYRTKVTIFSSTGNKLGTGVGSCSTMEGKYRFRTGEKTVTDKPVPQAYWTLRKSAPSDAQALIGKGNSTKKVDNNWFITSGGGDKVEHDNPADYYNTCLKMSKKRGVVDAVLTVTAASDIFTQDIEDMPEVIPAVAKAAEKDTTLEEEVIEAEHEDIPPEETESMPFGDQDTDKIAPPDSKGDISDPQRKKIYAMLMNAGIKGVDKDESDMLQRNYVSDILGFYPPLASMTNLSKAHAKMVIDELEVRKAAKG